MRRVTPPEVVARLNGSPLAVMLDIDGTLCAITERPCDATIPASAKEALRKLNGIDDDSVYLAFVTGRAAADAQSMLSLDHPLIYGNHGMERLSRAGNIRVSEVSETEQPALREAAREFDILTTDFDGSHLEDKRLSLSLHYRGIDMSSFPELDARARLIANRWSLRLTHGKRVMNVLPPNAVNKGNAVCEILMDTGADSPGSSILYVGDDVTDEDAFVALLDVPNATTVRVGEADAESAAQYAVDTPGHVHEILDLLAAARA